MHRAGIQPHREARPQKTDSRKQDEPSRKRQDGNLYPPVAMATPVRHREASHGGENMGNRMRAGMQNRGDG